MDARGFDDLARRMSRRATLAAGLAVAFGAGPAAGTRRRRRRGKACQPKCLDRHRCANGLCFCDDQRLACGDSCCVLGESCQEGRCIPSLGSGSDACQPPGGWCGWNLQWKWVGCCPEPGNPSLCTWNSGQHGGTCP